MRRVIVQDEHRNFHNLKIYKMIVSLVALEILFMLYAIEMFRFHVNP